MSQEETNGRFRRWRSHLIHRLVDQVRGTRLFELASALAVTRNTTRTDARCADTVAWEQAAARPDRIVLASDPRQTFLAPFGRSQRALYSADCRHRRCLGFNSRDFFLSEQVVKSLLISCFAIASLITPNNAAQLCAQVDQRGPSKETQVSNPQTELAVGRQKIRQSCRQLLRRFPNSPDAAARLDEFCGTYDPNKSADRDQLVELIREFVDKHPGTQAAMAVVQVSRFGGGAPLAHRPSGSSPCGTWQCRTSAGGQSVFP